MSVTKERPKTFFEGAKNMKGISKRKNWVNRAITLQGDLAAWYKE